MVTQRRKENLGKPRQIRLPSELEKDLQAIADANGLEWVDAVRLVARFGLPILKKKLGDSIKQAA